AQEVLEQDLDGMRQASDLAESLVGEPVQAVCGDRTIRCEHLGPGAGEIAGHGRHTPRRTVIDSILADDVMAVFLAPTGARRRVRSCLRSPRPSRSPGRAAPGSRACARVGSLCERAPLAAAGAPARSPRPAEARVWACRPGRSPRRPGTRLTCACACR